MNPADLDERLARIAPTTSPDPDRLDAARAALDAVVDALVDGAPSPRSRRVGGAHVLDLDEARVGLGDDVVLPEPDDEVVVPLTRGRTARERRRRRVQLGAAAAGVVGVVAVGLALSPWQPDLGPAGLSGPPSACASRLTTAAHQTEDVFASPTWRELAHESHADGTRLALLRSDDAGLTGFCAEDGRAVSSAASTTLWADDHPAEPGPDEVVPAGVRDDDDWYVAWGSAGEDVRDVRLNAEWADGRSGTQGLVVEARTLRDDEWVVFLRREELPVGATVSLLWRASDGSERSTPLEGAWPADPDTVTPPAEARRDACAGGRSSTGVEPVIEERHGDAGLTLLARDHQRFVVCQQDAEPPYEPFHTVSATTDDLPSSDEATPVVGGGSADARVLVGLAGDDVARVQLWAAGGTEIDATVSDGYWTVWAHGLTEQQWSDARVVWFLADGSRQETAANP
ncbi:hypothetical protein [Isoptericola sp. NPDC057191]|uniref:hypothetical protein n=1 Tax=Isoptericola sp. NPDC057191 TaxID=3346041 RepID=UPI003628C2A4